MRVSFLGTSGAKVSPDRDNFSVLIEINDRLILVDCSGNPVGKIMKLGHRMPHLDAVLITHLHIDHCYGLPELLFHMFLEGRTVPLLLASPLEDFLELEQQLGAYHLYPSIRTYDLVPLRIPQETDFLVTNLGYAIVRSSPVEHSRASRAYRIEDPLSGHAVVISGDTRPTEYLPDFAREADLLIHESTYLEDLQELAHEYGHSTAKDAAKTARAASCKALVLIHFDLDGTRSVEMYRAEAASVFDGPIYTPADLDTIDL